MRNLLCDLNNCAWPAN